MKVLLTGAFGNLGCLVLEQLLEHGHSVTCFDIKSKVNIKQAKLYLNKVTILWGDIRDEQTLKDAVKNQDAIIHLAAVIAPFSELNPKLAFDVNVGGTQKLIKVADQQQHKPLMIFASSISVFGNTQQLTPPRQTGDPLQATDHYSSHKIQCEDILQKSSLDWVILRIGAMTDSRLRHTNKQQFKLAFSTAASNRVEFIHPADAATAFVNALVSSDALGKILLLGGGKSCQVNHSQLVNAMTGAFGLEFEEKYFGSDVLYTDWLDTTEAQQLLDFQHHSFQDLIDEIYARFTLLRMLTHPFAPVIKPLIKKIAR